MRVRNSAASSRTSSRKSMRPSAVKIEDQPSPVEHLLDARQLHRQLQLADQDERGAARLFLAALLALACRAIVSSGSPDEHGLRRHCAPGRRRADRGHDGRERGPRIGADDHGIARDRRISPVIEQEGLRAAHGTKPHRHVRAAVRLLHGSPYRRRRDGRQIRRATQSATIFGLPLRVGPSASIASCTAVNAWTSRA